MDNKKEEIMEIIKEVFQCQFRGLFITAKHGTKFQKIIEEKYYNKISEKLDKLSETKTLNNNTPVDTICIIGVPPHL
jgi:vacuolar-type H+-ATPase subunit E/Vma4